MECILLCITQKTMCLMVSIVSITFYENEKTIDLKEFWIKLKIPPETHHTKHTEGTLHTDSEGAGRLSSTTLESCSM